MSTLCGAATRNLGLSCHNPVPVAGARCRLHQKRPAASSVGNASGTEVFAWGEECTIEVSIKFGPDYGRARCLTHNTESWRVAKALGAFPPCGWLASWPWVQASAGPRFPFPFSSEFADSYPPIPTVPIEGSVPRPAQVAARQLGLLQRQVSGTLDTSQLATFAHHWHPYIVAGVAYNGRTTPDLLGDIVDRLCNEPSLYWSWLVIRLSRRKDLATATITTLRGYVTRLPGDQALDLAGAECFAPAHEWLVTHLVPAVRLVLAGAPYASTSALEQLAADRHPDVAQQAAQSLAARKGV